MIDDEVRSLVLSLETENTPDSFEDIFKKIHSLLSEKLEKSECKERYAAYRENKTVHELGIYEIGPDGFGKSYDVLANEQELWDTWSRYGIAVGKRLVSEDVCKRAIERMRTIVRELSDGVCDLEDPSTWSHLPEDAESTPFISRGFFEVYHDAILAELRQGIRLYLHHVVLWGTTDLWTSFDRLGAKLPGVDDAKALPLHVDQNPRIHPQFKTVQGVLALSDCPRERGTFAGVPGSVSFFPQFVRFAPEQGEYVELPPNDELTQKLESHVEAIPLRAGDLVSWDSRTAHANTENISKDVRYVAYAAQGPARENVPELVTVRGDAYASGLGSNVREALMHASKKSRYTNPDAMAKLREPENLTLLGKLLYGQARYGDL